jgi:tetratricopeptide (TPR) repeat protein
LTEGFAVALDVDSEGLSLAQWAKAMRELHLAPDVNALLSTTGFYSAAPYRAYQYAGAFLRFIDEKYGRARLLELYATGDLRHLGKPETIISEFNHSLDSVKVTPSERAMAERALARPSVFHRRCAREVTHLSDEAGALLAEGRTQDALATYDRVCAMEPDDPALLEAMLRAAVKAKNNELRDKTASRIMSHPKTDSVLKAATLMELGDDDWRRGTLQEAAARYASIGELPVDPGTYRMALVKRTAVNDATLSALLQPFLVEGDAEVPQLFAMNDYIEAHPTDRLVRYLLGRQLVQREALARGLPLVDMASENLLFDGEMTAEALRVLVKGYSELHKCQAAQLELGKMAQSKASDADRTVGQDWIDRCQFEVSRGWKPWSDRAED